MTRRPVREFLRSMLATKQRWITLDRQGMEELLEPVPVPVGLQSYTVTHCFNQPKFRVVVDLVWADGGEMGSGYGDTEHEAFAAALDNAGWRESRA